MNSYVEPVASGKITELRAFIERCARAFGVLYSMRDVSIEAAFPETIASDEGRLAAEVRKAEQELAALQVMTDDEAKSAWEEAVHARYRQRQECIISQAHQIERYKKMLGQVEAWNEPTIEHRELKDFAREQLLFAIDEVEECEVPPILKPMTGAEWREFRIGEVIRNLEYWKDSLKREMSRVEYADWWLRELRESFEQKSLPTEKA